MSNELKLCPFCGGTEVKLTKCRTGWLFGWHVTCKHCLSVGATAYSDRVGVGAKTPEEKERAMKEYAVANWNHRVPPEHFVDANKSKRLAPQAGGGIEMGNKCIDCAKEFQCVIRKGSHKNCFKVSPTTNADRFRSMTNEELAVTLPCPNDMGMAEIACDHGDDKDCCACVLNWLNQPEEG